MASQRQCPACGAAVSPGDAFCGSCGALIPRNEAAAVQSAPAPEQPREKRKVQTPQTIDELLAFCERHELPLAKMRFFIGLDYPGARAYGIFQDKNGDFVVYKNKADGSRAVRYRGPDEAHAVREIFAKLKEEAAGQKAHAAAARAEIPVQTRAAGEKKSGGWKPGKILLLILAAGLAITIGRTVAQYRASHPKPGYYMYQGETYYSSHDNWYHFDTSSGDWYPIYELSDDFADNYADYYTTYSYDSNYGVSDFSDSEYYSYEADSGSSSSWDWDDDDSWDSSDDWDWDSDWDSDWGDWDSDW